MCCPSTGQVDDSSSAPVEPRRAPGAGVRRVEGQQVHRSARAAGGPVRGSARAAGGPPGDEHQAPGPTTGPADSTPGPGSGFAHQPVMQAEVVDLLGPVPPGLVVDATVGGGGHAAALLHAHPHLQVLGLDADAEAVAAATARLAPFGARAHVVQARFDRVAAVVGELGQGMAVVGVLFDLGVSSVQLDRPGRGFSYRHDAPLDMRMDRSGGPTAADVVNGEPVEALAALFAANGEGRLAGRLARAVVDARPLRTTSELAGVVADAVPAALRRRGHPARRVFQALRIAVNDELSVLERALPDALSLLAPGGRCVAISYHSGEDRLVKAAFRQAETGGCVCPPALPCACGATPTVRLLFRGARRPVPDEVAANHRADSARMRACERLGDAGAGSERLR